MKAIRISVVITMAITFLCVINYSCKKDKQAPVDTPVTAAVVKEEINSALAAKDSLTVFTTRFKEAKLSDAEVADGLTLFAPVNKAFNNVGVTASGRISASVSRVPVLAASSPTTTLPDTSDVRDYLIKGKIKANGLVSGTTFTTLSGKVLTITIKNGKPYLNDVLISGKDIASGADYSLHTLSGFINQNKLPAITMISDTKTFSGWLVTIEGQNFGTSVEANEVKFNGVKATINTATKTKLVVTVPADATSGKITLITQGKTLTSAQDIVIMQAKVSTINEITALNSSNIQGLALDADDNLYFTDNVNKRVVRYSSTGVTKTFKPLYQSATDVNMDGKVDAKDKVIAFSSPWGLAVDAQKNVYVSNNASYNGIYKMDMSDTTKSGWWAGNGLVSAHAIGQKASVSVRSGAMQFDKAGNLFLENGPWLDKISTNGILTNVVSAQSFRDADATVLKNMNILGITFDADGNTYLSDNANSRIWKIGTDGIKSFAGNNNTLAKDGVGSTAQFGSAFGLTIDKKGNLYVCDNDYNTDTYLIRMVNPLGVVTTIAGGKGSGDTDGVGKAARFNGVNVIATDSKGVFYIGTDNGRVRKLSIE